MPYNLEDKLVVGVASSAVFDLSESDKVFKEKGEEEYRQYQNDRLNVPLPKGMAFPFIKRLLSLNKIRENDPLVEVILLSHNDPDTGLRVMKTIKHYGLDITRAIFTQGESPYQYVPALNIALFLTANKDNVKDAISKEYPAGHVLKSTFKDDDDDDETLRIAFDFDGVLADDSSETVMQQKGLSHFHKHELANIIKPHNPGPLKQFLVKVSEIQKIEETFKKEQKKKGNTYKNRLRVAIVTARNAPSHERALNTLKSWNVMINDAFFLGGVQKSNILKVLKPHIFFDDQDTHLKETRAIVPSVHIPFGVTNQDEITPPNSKQQ